MKKIVKLVITLSFVIGIIAVTGFTDFDGFLYKAKLGEEQATKMSDTKINEFFIVGDDVYYTPFQSYDSSGEQKLYKLGNSNALVSGTVLNWATLDTNLSGAYLACRLYQLDTYPIKYKCLIVDQSGGMVSLETDDIQYISVYNGIIYEVISEEEDNSSNEDEKNQLDIKLVIDDEPVYFSKADGLGTPFIENDRTLVPLRKPLEAIDASVDYDAANRTVLIKKDETEISVVIDGGMLVNGSKEVDDV